MPRSPSLHAITANRLSDGVVIYWADTGEWVVDLQQACTDTDETALLARAKTGNFSLVAVDPYAVEVVQEAGILRPTALKEIIRTKGPTVREDLGKQVWGPSGHANA